MLRGRRLYREFGSGLAATRHDARERIPFRITANDLVALSAPAGRGDLEEVYRDALTGSRPMRHGDEHLLVLANVHQHLVSPCAAGRYHKAHAHGALIVARAKVAMKGSHAPTRRRAASWGKRLFTPHNLKTEIGERIGSMSTVLSTHSPHARPEQALYTPTQKPQDPQ